MSKYNTLPGIDISGKDVFETPDHEERSETTMMIMESDVEHRDIDTTQVDPIQAYSAFSGNRLDIGSQDYSDAIHKSKTTLRRKEVSGIPGRTEYEIVASDASIENETPLQRFQRLQIEISQLADDLKSDAESKAQQSDSTSAVSADPQLTSQVEALQQQFQEIVRDKKLQIALDPNFEVTNNLHVQNQLSNTLTNQISKFKASHSAKENESSEASVARSVSKDSSGAARELHYNPEQSRLETMSKYMNLEKRLAALEQQVGNTPATANVSSALSGSSIVTSVLAQNGGRMDLETTVRRLEQKITLLADPQMLEAVHLRLKSLNLELEKIKRRKQQLQQQQQSNQQSQGILPNTQHIAKVDELFEAVQRWEHLANQIPLLVARLLSLKHVHDSAISFDQSLETLAAQQRGITQLLSNNSELLDTVSGTMTENVTTIENNIQALDKRMAELTAKISQLTSK